MDRTAIVGERSAGMPDGAADRMDNAVPALPPSCTAEADAVRGLRHTPPQDRPRERLLAGGAASLSTMELLALLLGSGSRGGSAVTLASRLLQDAGSLTALLTRPAPVLLRQHGLGPARAAALLAVLELAQRVQLETIRRAAVLTHPQAVRDYLGLRLRGRAQEVFLVLFLDSQNRLISIDELFQGTLNQTAVYPREVARRALEHDAAAVILAHNHPSGVAEPSSADRRLTSALRTALGHLDIPVLDHIIVAGERHYSFAEQGELG